MTTTTVKPEQKNPYMHAGYAPSCFMTQSTVSNKRVRVLTCITLMGRLYNNFEHW